MKLNNVKRINEEDFKKEDRETIAKLGFIINNIFEQLGQILNKNINIADNLNEALVKVTVTVDSTGVPISRTEFKWTLKGQCQGLQVISATNATNQTTYPTSQPFITFEQSPGLIAINHVSGLQANNKYTLTVRATGN